MTQREIVGFDAVRTAARDYGQYSSRLLGDRDVGRSYHQLPLEADPPAHTAYRDILQPFFLASAIDQYVPAFADLARSLIDRITDESRGEIVFGLALPYVMGCLAIIYQRPQDRDEWVSWGADVWTAEAHRKGVDLSAARLVERERRFDAPSPRSGDVLESYLDRVFAEAEQREVEGIEPVDIWDHLQRLDFAGRRLGRDEKLGMGSLLLAGGRETVMKMITGFVWHVIRTPSDREWLTENPGARGRAISELARYLSPLPKMERKVVAATEHAAEGDLVLLNFASANHDPAAWSEPDEIDIHRQRNPHLAFGVGRHSCLGMNITERETQAFLSALLDEWPDWELDGEPEIEWITEDLNGAPITYLDRFERVDVRVSPVRPARVPKTTHEGKS